MTFALELHWGLFQAAADEQECVQELWRSAHREVCLNAPAYAMTAEWRLAYLIVHAARHNWQGLKWLVDIHAACSMAPGPDFARLAAIARQFNWESLCNWGLAIARTLMGTPMPASIPHQLPYDEKDLPILLLTPTSRWKCFRMLLRAEPKVLRKLRLVARRIFAPAYADYLVVQLPPSLDFLYYAVRPMRLAWSVIRRVTAR
jgi:hypothetical protein